MSHQAALARDAKREAALPALLAAQPKCPHRKTKIVATLGPASQDLIKELVLA
ncbi:hypothetical protein CAOG_010233, partial [Capsaspora owczarzaki ATCC 30864]